MAQSQQNTICIVDVSQSPTGIHASCSWKRIIFGREKLSVCLFPEQIPVLSGHLYFPEEKSFAVDRFQYSPRRILLLDVLCQVSLMQLVTDNKTFNSVVGKGNTSRNALEHSSYCSKFSLSGSDIPEYDFHLHLLQNLKRQGLHMHIV